ncbi:hypothetical protein ACFZB6_29295 [Streptomyces syringium]|uniref:hypothetical protein n=1 Tax=Streptomyces syringium TaxID=76729 RepID=UPI0036ED6AA4
MRVDSRVAVMSSALWLPTGRSTTEDALVDGVLDTDQDNPGVESVPECRGESPEHMAAEAVRHALAATGRTPQELDILAYAWTARFTDQPYSPPHRLAKALSVGDCATVGLAQACNGGAAAVETVVTRMLAEERAALAVAVTSDSFEPFGTHRWTEPAIMVVGDGAAAVVLARGPGPLALRSMATSGHTCADIMEAGQGLHIQGPSARTPADVHLSEAAHSVEHLGHCVNRSVRHALADADLEADDPGITGVLLPRLAPPFIDSFVRPALPEPLRGRAWVPDTHTGHLGAGDTLANVEYLQRCMNVAPAEHVLVVNGGQGVTASCLVFTAGTG